MNSVTALSERQARWECVLDGLLGQIEGSVVLIQKP